LGRSLSATLAWNYPTVEALAAHLAGGDAASAAPALTFAPLAGPLVHVAELSDEEAAQALRGSRKRGAR
jgi:myxalamid-type polyketide synthase MxaE and MxaD